MSVGAAAPGSFLTSSCLHDPAIVPGAAIAS